MKIIISLLVLLNSLHCFAKTTIITEHTFKTKVQIKEFGIHNKQSMVLVHGLGQNAAKDWDPIRETLSKKYHLILLDLPGFGKSEKSPEFYTPTNYAKLISQVIEKFSKEEKAIVVGHSLGGAVTLRFAYDYPELIKELILIDAAGILYRSIFIKHLSQFSQKSKKRYPFMGLINKVKRGINILSQNIIEFTDKYTSLQDLFMKNEQVRASLAKDKTTFRAATALIEENFTDAINQMKVPTLIIWGDDDKVAPLRVGKLLNYRLKNSHLIILKETGHNPMAERPKKVSESILGWLNNPTIPMKKEIELQDRVYECEGKRGKFLTGSYSKIILKNCNDILLKNVIAKSLVMKNSSAFIENTIIKGTKIGIDADESVITATSLTVTADTPLKLNKSKMDLAGTYLNSNKRPLQASGKSLIYWSVSRINSSNSPNKNMHQRSVYTDE